MILFDSAKTKMIPVLAGSSTRDIPANRIKPRMKLTKILGIAEARCVDFAAIVVGISCPKDVQNGGRTIAVRDVIVRDGSVHNGGMAGGSGATQRDWISSLLP